VLHDIVAEQRYAHMTVGSQVLLRNLLPDLGRLTPAQRAYIQHRASVDFVVYNRVTNQPLLAIEVDGFAFHENSRDQQKRDALKTRSWMLTRCHCCGYRPPAAGNTSKSGRHWTTPKPTGPACQPGDLLTGPS
jgi:hypothetical protein